MTSSTLQGLNPQQAAAVIHRGGPLLVLAGAGSGKTRVITVRIRHLIETGTPPDSILALTFTNKAAREMEERLVASIGHEAAKKVTVGTFHSLGLRIVRRYASKLGLTSPVTLLDAGDQAVAVRRCFKAVGLDASRHDPAVFLSAISAARHEGLTPDGMEDAGGKRFTARVYRSYLEMLREYRTVDFDGLILEPLRLMSEHPEIGETLRAQYQHILVDEYQDTNRSQLRLVSELARDHRNLAVVGDDDQSIYGWRGACIDNILAFESHFPDATVIALEQNYRSTGNVLASANAVIGQNTSRKVKALWTAGGSGEPVGIVTCKDAESEANFVVAEMDRLRRSHHYTHKDFGVLFRAGSQAKPMEQALRLAGVPYRVVGAHSFFQRKEIKDVLAYLRVLNNPRDRAGFIRVVNFPQRGIGPRSVEALTDFSKRTGADFISACKRASEVYGLNRKQVASLNELGDQLGRLAGRLSGGSSADLATIIATLCEETGARTAWIRDPTEGPGGEGRWKSVESLMDSVRRWQQAHPAGGLSDYLAQVTLDGRSEEQQDDNPDEVSLMTIHSAKGLEWPVCFVIGCQEGTIPHQRTLEEGGDVSEERRLFYVAMTRARERLFLVRARSRKTFRGSEPARPSRFLADVPEASAVEVNRARGAEKPEKSETKQRFAELLSRLGEDN